MGRAESEFSPLPLAIIRRFLAANTESGRLADSIDAFREWVRRTRAARRLQNPTQSPPNSDENPPIAFDVVRRSGLSYVLNTPDDQQAMLRQDRRRVGRGAVPAIPPHVRLDSARSTCRRP